MTVQHIVAELENIKEQVLTNSKNRLLRPIDQI